MNWLHEGATASQNCHFTRKKRNNNGICLWCYAFGSVSPGDSRSQRHYANRAIRVCRGIAVVFLPKKINYVC